MLAIFPAHSAKAIGDGSYTAQLERYLDDHAVLRDTLLKAQVRADLLRRPVVNGIVITPECLLLPYHPPPVAVGGEEIRSWAESMADNLKRISGTVAEYGGYYCYVADPCQYVYFEDDCPWYLDSRREGSALAAALLSQTLEERGVNFLDVRAAFNSQGHPDEYGPKVDNHGTMAGAFET